MQLCTSSKLNNWLIAISHSARLISMYSNHYEINNADMQSYQERPAKRRRDDLDKYWRDTI